MDVHLILPGKPDKAFAYALAKTHYLPLLSSGVKISEWTPGFTHAKVMIMDGQEAVVGTINLDYRSLYHHFEDAVWMRGVDCLPRIEADFQDTLAQCRTVEPTRQSIWQGKKLLHLVGIVLKFIRPARFNENAAPGTDSSNVSGAFFAYAFAPAGTLPFFSVEGIAFNGSPTT